MGKEKIDINEMYIERQSYNFEDEPEIHKKYYFLSEMFGLTTYDLAYDIKFVGTMLEVIDVILNKKTFQYIENKENYEKYLTMINFPFLIGKLTWGTSIRSAWFENDPKQPYDIMQGIEIYNIEMFCESLLEWCQQEGITK